ncbi:MAG TPA: lamin tail domain-containing protein, partial [Puia sp.]|nr:lamin tail domain-containing protein [Puia sp.]
MIRVLRALALSILTLSLSAALHAQFAAPGHIAVLQGDLASSNNGTCTILEFNTTDAGQSFITSKAIPGTGTNAFRMSASAGTTGYLANTDDGTLLCFMGANNATATGNSNALNPRGVGTLDGSQNFSIATTYTGTSGNQTRGVTSIDNLNWFIADQGGIYTNNGVAASPAGNVLSAKSFGGTVYVGSAKLAAVVSTVSAASGGTITSLPGLNTTQGNFTDFYLISSGSNGTSYDILYTIGSDGILSKYSLVSGTWTANGTYTTGTGGYGLAAKRSGTAAELYISSGNGATGGNSLMKYTDATGYNAAITISSTVVNLYAAPAASTIKGVAFTPTTSGGTPPVIPSVNLTVSANAASEAAGTVVTVTATASAAVTGDQTMTLTVSGSHITATDYSISGAAVATPNLTTITIPNGATTGTVTFTVLNDTEVEDPETAALTISNPSSGIILGTATQNIAITDDDVSPRLMRITEYMYGGANGEFIEFTNVGSAAIDMTNWSFSDNAEIPGAVNLTAFGIVKPGESVILTETAASAFRTDWALCNGQKVIGGNTTNLGRADEINLYDENELLVDRLTYDDQTLHGVRANNISAWVSPAAMGKNISTSWALSVVGDGESSVTSVGGDIGSPGKSSLVTPYSPCIAVVPGAPTIGLDVAATSDLVDGGIAASPANSFAVSGVTNDPTDPASTLGVAITIADGDNLTPVDDLTFTVASSNLTVVP